jgi:hypothetical protein
MEDCLQSKTFEKFYTESMLIDYFTESLFEDNYSETIHPGLVSMGIIEPSFPESLIYYYEEDL